MKGRVDPRITFGLASIPRVDAFRQGLSQRRRIAMAGAGASKAVRRETKSVVLLVVWLIVMPSPSTVAEPQTRSSSASRGVA